MGLLGKISSLKYLVCVMESSLSLSSVVLAYDGSPLSLLRLLCIFSNELYINSEDVLYIHSLRCMLLWVTHNGQVLRLNPIQQCCQTRREILNKNATVHGFEVRWAICSNAPYLSLAHLTSDTFPKVL